MNSMKNIYIIDWVRPSEDERPKDAIKIESACYC